MTIFTTWLCRPSNTNSKYAGAGGWGGGINRERERDDDSERQVSITNTAWLNLFINFDWHEKNYDCVMTNVGSTVRLK